MEATMAEQREPFDITPADVGRYVRDRATGHVGRVERDRGNGWLYPTLRYEWKTFRDEFEYVEVILPPSAAPSQPQQKDLGAETVLDAEPGQPSNPVVREREEIRAWILNRASVFAAQPADGLVRCSHIAEELNNIARVIGLRSTFPSPDPLRVALEYAASVLENEYRSDPTLQDLARSLRAALEARV